MTQAELSKALRDRGHSHFHPTTISRIEKGERPLRLSDALALSAVLGVYVDDFRPPNTAERMFQEILGELRDARKEVRRAIYHYRQVWWSAAAWHRAASEDGHQIEDAALRMFVREFEDPEGFEKDVALAVRLAKERNAAYEDSEGYLERAKEYNRRFVELLSEGAGDDGVDPEEA